jgi:hypothetical protein
MKRNIVLEWRTFNLWSKQFLKINKDLLNEAVLDKFKSECATDDIYSDDISWLEDIVMSVNPEPAGSDLEGELTSRLEKSYSAVRAFHAGCPRDVSTYYEKGLLPLDPEVARKAIKSHFLDGDFPELSESELDAAIEDTSFETREGRIYFNLDERLLIEHCGHYLLYGSEFATGVAASLNRNGTDKTNNYQKSLKNIGRPTMFICDVPWNMISEDTKGELMRTFMAELFLHLKTPFYRPTMIDFGFSIRCRLPPAQIAGHYHPEGVRDPIG